MTASIKDRNVASAALVAAGCSWMPDPKASAMASTVPAAMKKAISMPSMRPSMRNTMAPTHIWNVTEPVASDR